MGLALAALGWCLAGISPTAWLWRSQESGLPARSPGTDGWVTTALQEKLYTLSYRDGLTGFFDRRYFEETLRRELDRAERYYGMPLSLIMVDISAVTTPTITLRGTGP